MEGLADVGVKQCAYVVVWGWEYLGVEKQTGLEEDSKEIFVEEGVGSCVN